MKWLFFSLVVLLGLTNISQSLYIYHGDRVQEGEMPFHVSVQTLRENGASYCGGSLIRPNFVLTAAHCVVGDNTLVAYGGVVLDELPEAQVVDLKIVHENWEEWDVALLRLFIPVNNISYVPLAGDQDRDTEGRIFTVAGYGRTAANESTSDYLLKASGVGISNEDCGNYFPDEFPPGYVFPDQILCTLPGDDYNSSACPGDSGSPLISRNSEGNPVLYGVVSAGSDQGCDVGLPVRFTRVSVVRSWIDEQIALHE